MESIGERIRNLRESRNLTQGELAELVGAKTYTTISKWESNNNFPKGKDLKMIANIFNVSSDYLLGLEDNMTKIASKIKYALYYRGIKPKELSEKTGISRSSISEWLSGKYEPKQDKILLIAEALNVDEGWLLGLNVSIERESSISTIFNQLDTNRQQKVHCFAKQLLHEQQNKIARL